MTKDRMMTFSGRAEVYWTVEMPVDQVNIDAEGFDPVKSALEESMPQHEIYMAGQGKAATRVSIEIADPEDIDIDDDPRDDEDEADDDDSGESPVPS